MDKLSLFEAHEIVRLNWFKPYYDLSLDRTKITSYVFTGSKEETRKYFNNKIYWFKIQAENAYEDILKNKE